METTGHIRASIKFNLTIFLGFLTFCIVSSFGVKLTIVPPAPHPLHPETLPPFWKNSLRSPGIIRYEQKWLLKIFTFSKFQVGAAFPIRLLKLEKLSGNKNYRVILSGHTHNAVKIRSRYSSELYYSEDSNTVRIWNMTIWNLETFEIWTFWRSDFKWSSFSYG